MDCRLSRLLARIPAEGNSSQKDQSQHGDPGKAGHLFDLLFARFHLAHIAASQNKSGLRPVDALDDGGVAYAVLATGDRLPADALLAMNPRVLKDAFRAVSR